MLLVEVAVAKASKYAVRESGDTVEVIERPRGGLSLVMADGQRSGRSAKAISNIAVRKAVSLLAEGVRDGAVARAAHDYLRTTRAGQVTAELTIVSVDLETHTLVISRNSQCPVLIGRRAQEEEPAPVTWQALDEPTEPVGIHAHSRPSITELPLAAGQIVVAFTDGLLHAGARRGVPLAYLNVLAGLTGTAAEIADGLLTAALAADEGRPADDVTVLALCVTAPPAPETALVRRMQIVFPVDGGA